MRESLTQILFVSALLLFSVLTAGDYLELRAVEAAPSPTLVSDLLPNDFEISFNKTNPTVPCVCRPYLYLGQTSADEERQLVVSVTTNSAVRSPLTYRYSVSAGKINGEGPTVVWDFDGLAPGNYEITVSITDAADMIGKSFTKAVEFKSMTNCDCPHSCPSMMIRSSAESIRPGDQLDFHVVMLGGDLRNYELAYQWKVSRGLIKSGQNTRELTIRADRSASEGEVGVQVEISGMDPFANCPNVAFRSVPIGKQTIRGKSGKGVLALILDDKRLIIGCPPGVKGCSTPSSPDMIIETLLETMHSRPDSLFRYSVTAGKIIGSGKRVQWDLSNTAPGTYQIKALEFRKGKPIGNEISETVTVEREQCICDPSCPAVSISGPASPPRAGDSFLLNGSISGGSQDRAMMYNWIISSGKIVSGQGSPMIKVQTPINSGERNITVTLNIGGVDPSFNCLTRVSEQFPIKP